ncbi:MAG: glutamine-hydrolyzing carbamoyl-phosphate synthase small subunit, partial [Sphingomonadaceae bacterium]
MADTASYPAQPKDATGVLVLADGTVIWGRGFGANGAAVGEICFNTAMTGYQEIMTDPSYAGQIVTFTFPHIGNVGTNAEDAESHVEGAIGCVVREDVTRPSSFRAEQDFSDWLASQGKIGIAGIDTRALTRRIRLQGAPNAVIAHAADGRFDIPALHRRAQEWAGLVDMDLAIRVTRDKAEVWEGGPWQLGKGYGRAPRNAPIHVVAIDYGIKDNILRNLVRAGARVTVVSAQASPEEILALEPDGVFLSNGPGDPAATAEYAVPVIRALLERDMPLFGICLGHQLLGLAVGAKTAKMYQGHRGANHPVQRVGDIWGESEGLVEITSMNHGFAVDGASLP